MKKDGVLLLILSLFVIYYAFSFHSSGEWALSPGLFPLITGFTLFLFSLELIRRGFREGKVNRVPKLNWRGTLVSIALTIGYILSLPFLHFNLSTIIYLGLFFLILGVRSVFTLTVLSFGLAMLVYLVFGVLLKVVLP